MELAVSGSGFHVQPSRKLMIEGKVLSMKYGVDLRCAEGSRSQQSKVSTALDQKRIKLNLMHTREIKIFPDQVEMKFLGAGSIRRAARHIGILMSEHDVREFRLVRAHVQICVDFFDRFAVSGRPRCVNVSLHLWMRARPENLQRDIGGSGDRIVEARQGRS